ncbi:MULTISPECIES: lanthionine synthetase C family protein [unclassified Sphingobacterium]|uniref:lanthionine synthetase C family protein n=1 Tax=unclassified Sphingobacterium TaxID=2609468 RepID=UPI001048068E|nr:MULTISPECIES: lanthionine synthetase C family protein [unclassified Sphingobacterium]MCS3557564.1 hypothetical protein [Sphingobacterium sp. JUb21]TCQ95791.1 lanthionine synthetase-like protein [Sphingobacterium sp. JUb20]
MLFRECIHNKVEEIYNVILLSLKEKKYSNGKGLYDGNIGISLFLIQYLEYNAENIDEVEAIIGDLITEFMSSFDSYSFCSGLSGGLYLFEILKEKNLLEIETNDIIEQLDKYLSNNLESELENGHYDFMHGALGIGLFYLKIGQIEKVQKIVNYLSETAIYDDKSKGYKWNSNVDYSGEIAVNISLSHGMSSIVIFLSKVIEKKIAVNMAFKLLRGAVNFLLSQELDYKQYGSYFPYRCIEEKSKSRLSWCYGDLGVAIGLFKASFVLNDSSLRREALFVLEESTKRNMLTEDNIIEGGVCHGSAGLAMIYNRMFLETKNEIFLDASKYWLEQTLRFSKFDNGLAGYLTNYNKEWHQDLSLLTGISGIGVVFLSYLKGDEQYWDEMFLM